MGGKPNAEGAFSSVVWWKLVLEPTKYAYAYGTGSGLLESEPRSFFRSCALNEEKRTWTREKAFTYTGLGRFGGGAVGGEP